MTENEMKELGYRVIDYVVEHRKIWTQRVFFRWELLTLYPIK